MGECGLLGKGEGEVEPMSDDGEATKRFIVLSILASYCGVRLTGDVIEKIAEELYFEMTNGSCSWAFREAEAARERLGL